MSGQNLAPEENRQEQVRKELCNLLLKALNYQNPAAIPDQLKYFSEAYRAMFGAYQGGVLDKLEEQVRAKFCERMLELLADPRVMSFSGSVKTLAEAYGTIFNENLELTNKIR